MVFHNTAKTLAARHTRNHSIAISCDKLTYSSTFMGDDYEAAWENSNPIEAFAKRRERIATWLRSGRSGTATLRMAIESAHDL
jgi:hypothetical protein